MSRTPKLTPWFPGDVNPVRIGLYERQYRETSADCPDLWDGKRWQLCNVRGEVIGASRGSMPWRGLASDPQAAK